MIVDGKSIAEELHASLRTRRDSISRPITLGILVSAADSVIESFVRIKSQVADKLDIRLERVDLLENASTADAISAVTALASRSDAIIVQLPLANNLDTDAILSEIPKEKDVDAINLKISYEQHIVRAPVACAVVEILKRSNIEVSGKKIVVIGAGRLVGAPTAALLSSLGGDVSLITLDEGSMSDLKDADIIVSGAGQPGLIRPDHIKEGVVIIDAGTSEQGGMVRGDADPACADKASVFTPVPGGVGPVAVAMIFSNLLDLIETRA